MKKLKIKQIRSIIDRPQKQKRTIEALGLGRPNWFKLHNDTPQIRGMINKVSHMVVVEEVDDVSTDGESTVEKKKIVRKKPAAKPKSQTVKKKTPVKKKKSES